VAGSGLGAAFRVGKSLLGLDDTYMALRHAARYALRVSRPAKWRERGAYSFMREDAILCELVEAARPAHSVVVDIGASDGITWSNSRLLVELGWRGVLIEADPGRFAHLALVSKAFEDAALIRGFANPDNVCGMLRAHGVPPEFGVLSLDIDSFDHDVLAALLAEFQPRIICAEFNEYFRPPIRFALRMGPDALVPDGLFFGHSLSALDDLGRSRGYRLAAVHRNNAFLVHHETGIPAVDVEAAYQSGFEHLPETERRFRDDPLGRLTKPVEEVVAAFRERLGDSADKVVLGTDPLYTAG
jgi:hypothetical protein